MLYLDHNIFSYFDEHHVKMHVYIYKHDNQDIHKSCRVLFDKIHSIASNFIFIKMIDDCMKIFTANLDKEWSSDMLLHFNEMWKHCRQLLSGALITLY